MLSQFETLERITAEHYATDEELQFLLTYTESFNLRKATYQVLQSLETQIVQETYYKLAQAHPEVFQVKGQELSTKWKVDTTRVLRYIAAAVLLDDGESLRNRFLLWFQTLMKAFGVRRNCYLTYEVLKAVLQNNLMANQYRLIEPFLEMTQAVLGGTLEEFKAD